MMTAIARCLLSVCCAVALSAIPAWSADNPFQPKLPFDSAVIKYQLQGNEKGSAVLYVQGQKSARQVDSQLTMHGNSQPRKTLTITTPDQVIEVDLVSKSATTTGNPANYMAQEYNKLSAAKQAIARRNAEKMGGSMMNLFSGGANQPKEGTFLGKPVQIVTIMGLTSYTWKDTGILLKMEGDMMGVKTKEEATSIETNQPVDAKVFEVPAGITPVFDNEADEQMRQMAKNMVEIITDPEMENEMKK